MIIKPRVAMRNGRWYIINLNIRYMNVMDLIKASDFCKYMDREHGKC